MSLKHFQNSLTLVVALGVSSPASADLFRLLDPLNILPDNVTDPLDIKKTIENAVREEFGDDAANIVAMARLPEALTQSSAETVISNAEEFLTSDLTLLELLESSLGIPVEVGLRHTYTELLPHSGPIPQDVRQLLYVGFDRDLVDSTRVIESDFDPNLAGQINTLNTFLGENVPGLGVGGPNHAIVVGNLIVFETVPGTESMRFWAHEMVHVEQYRELGFSGFAREYSTNFGGVESAADTRAQQFLDTLLSIGSVVVSLTPAPEPYVPRPGIDYTTDDEPYFR